MEYRRLANVVSNISLGHDTKLMPQLEDYDLFRSGICDPYVPMGQFRLVLNVVCIAPQDLKLTFPEDNILQVTVRHGGTRLEGLTFARDCTIKYVLPDEVNKNNLVASWHADRFLVIYEKTVSGDTAGGSLSDAETTVSESTNIPVVDLEGPSSGPKDRDGAAESGPKDRDGAAESGPKDRDGAAESGPKDRDGAAESGPKDRDGAAESGPKDEDVKILKPVFVKQKFKPIIDVDELRDLFTEVADEASMDEKYMLGYFFTSPNAAREKLVQRDHPLLRDMLSKVS